jgi:hypothetical protein
MNHGIVDLRLLKILAIRVDILDSKVSDTQERFVNVVPFNPVLVFTSRRFGA